MRTTFLTAYRPAYLAIIFFLSCKQQNNHNQDTDQSVNAIKTAIQKPALLPDTSASPTYDTARRYIYLTFDDGPQPGTTHCVQTIKSMDVKASFFMVGMHAWDAHLKKIVDTIRNSFPQILLVNHSFTHAFRDHYKTFYTHPYDALKDFKKAQDSLNISYKIARLPGNSAFVQNGNIRASKLVKPVCNLLDSAGFEVVGWDVEWNFKPEHGGARPVQNVSTMIKMVNNTFNKNECYRKNNLVLLAHDRMFHSSANTDSLYKFVALLKQNPHYVFEAIDKYPMQKKDRLQ